jgi:hypothetical protein
MTASNTLITPTILAKQALRLLDNNLVFGSLVNRSYEDEFAKKSNGNKPGDTINVRKPVRYTVRDGSVASPQNTVEASTSIVVNKKKGVDLQFSSNDLTLKITEFSDRYLKSAMIQLANQVDTDLAALGRNVWNWVGTPGNTISTFAGFAAGSQRLDEMAVPAGDRVAALSPADQYGLAGTFTGLFVNDIAKTAIQKAKLPMIAGIDAYSTQNVQTHVVGALGGTPLVNGATQNVTYDGTNAQSLITDGWTSSVTGVVKAGDVFTIAGVYAVNPITKATLPYLQQFVVNADADSGASTGPSTLNISPAIITSGAYQTVSAAPADNAAITIKGTAATGYPSNLMFHRDAFALCMVPMELPQGAVNPARESYKGLSVRVVPYYDGPNDLGNWRLDILYGVKAIYPDLATRVSGA